MGFTNKLNYKIQELRGRIKRNAGEITGNRNLQADGSVDETKASLKQTGEKIKDALRGRRTYRRGR
jgi:uncharacterized protein YjbJ (UPF0337 family)